MKHSLVYDSASQGSECRDCGRRFGGGLDGFLTAIARNHDCPALYRRHRLVMLGEGSHCLTCGQSWTDEQRREHPPEMSPPWATEPCPAFSPEGVGVCTCESFTVEGASGTVLSDFNAG